MSKMYRRKGNWIKGKLSCLVVGLAFGFYHKFTSTSGVKANKITTFVETGESVVENWQSHT